MDGESYSEDETSPTTTSPATLCPPSRAFNPDVPPFTHNTLHPSKDYLEAESSRSRSSSFGQESSLSGKTAHTETPYSNEIMPKQQKNFDGIEPTLFDDAEALHPDPGDEKYFQVENNRFAYSPGQLNKFLNPKSLAAYKAVGGIRGLQKGLRTDVSAGLSIDESLVGNVTFQDALEASTAQGSQIPAIERPASSKGLPTDSSGPFSERIRIFGDNRLPSKKGKTIWRLMWEQYNDKILILLSFAAVISLALGLYETFGADHSTKKSTVDDAEKPVEGLDWIEGVAIVVAIVIVVLVGSLNDWQKERQFVKLNTKVCPSNRPVFAR